MIGFAASAWGRLGLALAFSAAAVAMVLAVESRPVSGPPAAASPAAAPTRSLRLEAASTFPVAQWRISVLGAEQAPASSDAHSWSGAVAVPAGEEVLVQAIAAPGAAANRALRLRLGDAPERLVWGSGDMTVAEPAP